MSASTPAFPSSTPYGSPQPVAPVARPRQVEIGFWLFLAAAVLAVVNTIVSLAAYPAARDSALRQLDAQGQTGAVSQQTIDAILVGGLVFGVVVAVVEIILWVVFAILMRKGHGWTRWVFAAFAALSLFGILGNYGLGALQSACLIAGTLLVLVPVASRQFFAAARANRLAKRNVA